MSITLIGTILVVKDSLSELELISHFLRDKGYNIIKATSAQEALEIVLEEKPDAIVTDVVMPGMSGFELCRFLNINLTNQKVPIVICSSKNQAIHHLWARKQSADAYITKPYTLEQLLSVIQSIKV
ncbi:response regulator [aff. Roholtiella sp. LEGE 12411]|uniref:response regulator n=1 Tax=aff. Roholtiella sp. LEGE 12411 TaxID=1828822 RepID=UPI001882D0D4|nr:response regulator [aff. Roholtiella sp. LEGE 12411]MBE9034550.1 response regulator [aff. Roholtiella sp. LEGE 12411]